MLPAIALGLAPQYSVSLLFFAFWNIWERRFTLGRWHDVGFLFSPLGRLAYSLTSVLIYLLTYILTYLKCEYIDTFIPISGVWMG